MTNGLVAGNLLLVVESEGEIVGDGEGVKGCVGGAKVSLAQ